MKHVQPCLCARKDLESSFNHFGCPVARPTLFKYHERSRKHFPRSYKPVEVPCSWKPVYVPERPDKTVLTAEEVL